MINQRSLFFNVDWMVILVYISLCIIGWLNIHAAVFDPANPDIFDFGSSYGKQLLFILSAVAIGIVILLLDSKFIIALSPALYIGATLLLVLVLFIGKNIGGNQAWIKIGGFAIQPSEFAKFSTCLLLAKYLSSSNTKVQDTKTRLSCGAIIFLPVLLILLQPDAGSALTFTSLIFVLYREGLSGYFLVVEALAIVLFIVTLLYNKLLVLAGIAVFTGLLIWMFKRNRQMIMIFIIGAAISIGYVFSVDFAYNHILKQHHRNRIDVMLGKISDPKGEGYNQAQSKIAIGSGRLWGKGYLQGTQARYGYVPAKSTDFIFCTVGEEWGFAGCFVVVSLYVFLLMKIIIIAERQRSSFTRIYGYGVASIIFFHFVVNIGMTIGLVPIIGIPLPFLSYGGSSLWSFTILLFILLKFDSNRMGLI